MFRPLYPREDIVTWAWKLVLGFWKRFSLLSVAGGEAWDVTVNRDCFPVQQHDVCLCNREAVLFVRYKANVCVIYVHFKMRMAVVTRHVCMWSAHCTEMSTGTCRVSLRQPLGICCIVLWPRSVNKVAAADYSTRLWRLVCITLKLQPSWQTATTSFWVHSHRQ
jgi:hypothetical protein